ncbi:hypothetical protein ACFLV7_15605, partial [Chloroflexota bacterium]
HKRLTWIIISSQMVELSDGGVTVGVSVSGMVGFNVADVILSSFRGASVSDSARLVETAAGVQAAAVNKNKLPIKGATQGGSLMKGATLPA